MTPLNGFKSVKVSLFCLKLIPVGVLCDPGIYFFCLSAACTDSGGVPRSHGEVWKASQDGCCVYRCDNDTIVPVEYDCSSAPAPVCHRTGEMIISMSDDTSCCPHKVCGEPTKRSFWLLWSLKEPRNMDIML